MKCKKIQEQGNVNLQLQNKKKQKLKEKGITLIALVVTIIILLILAGVTLNIALSGDGLFSRARNAAEKYKKAQKDETELISEIGKEMNSEYVGAYVEGYEPTGGECIITSEQSGVEKGDKYLDTEIENLEEDGSQIFTTKEEGALKWRIWDYDGTTLRIILDRATTQKLTLKGAAGYNNGVWVINEICRKCFGQYEEDGETMKSGISVANLRRSDIEKVSTYDYTTFKNSEGGDWLDNGLDEGFGSERVIDNNMTYPKVWVENDSKWEPNGYINENRIIER